MSLRMVAATGFMFPWFGVYSVPRYVNDSGALHSNLPPIPNLYLRFLTGSLRDKVLCDMTLMGFLLHQLT